MTMNNNYFGYPQPYVYVIKCTTPGKYYVGSTFRQFYKRMDEHKGGHCIWTRRHGFGRVVAKIPCSRVQLSQRENEVWMHYARHVCGPENVRGGDVTFCGSPGDPLPPWVLPEEFGGERLVTWG